MAPHVSIPLRQYFDLTATHLVRVSNNSLEKVRKTFKAEENQVELTSKGQKSRKPFSLIQVYITARLPT
jgi:hypothetical protein